MVDMKGTTIISIRDKNSVHIAGDGQVTLGNSVMKGTAKKVRRLMDGSIIAGFAGSTADAFTLFERLERKLSMYPGKLMRACVELASDWRSDKYLRKLEAMMIVADKEKTFILTGNGDVLEPEDGICSIGSGSTFALGAAYALHKGSKLKAKEIAIASLEVAAKFCIYTNSNFTIESIENK